ncbi:hypothetical protein P175DRAFT_0553719 [Aspergillus ochraceoroseus IBT 24754]|uniref:BSD domain-containing protein n=3 Tax=Aspergillus subgen. Nidulantes TaxID=2720870 RepID=A0A0F8XDF0_9EURO|nr:uncharacterized protein P175DRAFT_0553719 [Aspergillus ochraceoroseus IBT 24754]KKK18877.1 hypothetical protein AOCH_006285 [Aspergillus ochraceoroseus]KKK21612.1 hypothetical protein ARAM_004119 [Aspergillus rambellii]PTU24441.1 hypothetical protein P175DRAFT_0553719 [Aspergillus ochraceoroseus IBT 24754]
MDIYDHIQGEIFSTNESPKKDESQQDESKTDRPPVDLNSELQETFRAFSASPWGARIGGLWDNVRKQGESYYEGARQEYAAASEEAAKGFSGLKDSIVGRTRGLSLSTAFNYGSAERGTEGSLTPTETHAEEPRGEQKGGDPDTKAGEGFLTRIKAEAARRLKEIEKAEEAADEAILRFGMNITQKLREAVSIVPPDTESSNVLFESKDSDGKRVIHATRFEAQLHVIHTNLESFTKDPASDQWAAFKESFKVDDKTDAIAADLEKYPELRSSMEKLVPEQVQYAEFWSRYYFLRLVIETEEQKRKELLKGANVEEEEEVGWDDDSDDDTDSPSTPQVSDKTKAGKAPVGQTSTDSNNTLKPNEPRRSNDQISQADSESSYDLVSGATSRTPASPKEKPKDDDSDDDWE